MKLPKFKALQQHQTTANEKVSKRLGPNVLQRLARKFDRGTEIVFGPLVDRALAKRSEVRFAQSQKDSKPITPGSGFEFPLAVTNFTSKTMPAILEAALGPAFDAYVLHRYELKHPIQTVVDVVLNHGRPQAQDWFSAEASAQVTEWPAANASVDSRRFDFPTPAAKPTKDTPVWGRSPYDLGIREVTNRNSDSKGLPPGFIPESVLSTNGSVMGVLSKVKGTLNGETVAVTVSEGWMRKNFPHFYGSSSTIAAIPQAAHEAIPARVPAPSQWGRSPYDLGIREVANPTWDSKGLPDGFIPESVLSTNGSEMGVLSKVKGTLNGEAVAVTVSEGWMRKNFPQFYS